MSDVAIIGAGPAGLSAAVVLGRALREVTVIDGNRPRNAGAGGLYNFLTREATPPQEFLAVGRAEAERYGARFFDGTVEAVTESDSGFRLELAEGEVLQARRVLVATGLRDVLPELPGLAERWGRTVFHCGHCHGYEARGAAVGILGHPLGAALTALLWRGWTEDLVLFLNDAVDLDPAQQRQLEKAGVRIVPGQVTSFAEAGVRLADGELVPRDHLVVHSRMEARVGFLEPLGLKTAELPMNLGTFLPVEDPTGRTAAPGVWAAGNVSDARAQSMASAAAGVTAGEAIAMDLVLADLV